MNNMPRLMMAMAGLMLTTGCPPKDIDADVDEDKLTGLSYVLESAEGYTLVEESNFMLFFSESAQGETYFSASTGCNSIDGIYSIDDGVMNVDMMSITEIWCSDELSTQEDWLLDFFHSAPLVNRSGDRMFLENESAMLTFLDREVATPDLSLTEATWSIDTIIEGKGISTTNLEAYPVMWFSDDGTFGFSSVCTEIEGEYTTSGAVLSLSNVLLTIIECDDAMASSFDTPIIELIDDGEFSYSIDASRLTIEQDSYGISGIGE